MSVDNIEPDAQAVADCEYTLIEALTETIVAQMDPHAERFGELCTDMICMSLVQVMSGVIAHLPVVDQVKVANEYFMVLDQAIHERRIAPAPEGE